MRTVLPWKRLRPITEATVASITELQLRRWRDVPRLVEDALRLRQRLRSVHGAVALGLAADPFRRTFWTLSLWTDDRSIADYFRHGDHLEIMRRYHGRLEHSRSARWPVDGDTPPRWRAAWRRLDTSGPKRASSRPGH